MTCWAELLYSTLVFGEVSHFPNCHIQRSVVFAKAVFGNMLCTAYEYD